MPEMDGITLLKKIKSENRFHNLPVIMQTSADEKKEILEGLEAGAYYYLTKPYDKEVIMPVVNAAIKDFKKYKVLEDSISKYKNSINLLSSASFKFKTIREADAVSTLLAQTTIDSKRTVVGLTELTYNAIEHGNLEIDYSEKTKLIFLGTFDDEIIKRLSQPKFREKNVELTFEKNDKYISIHIKDEGNGFEWEQYMDFSIDRVFDTHGRGIAIANKTTFDTIEYLGKGNEVIATIKLPAMT